jgi:hypothetical protein
MAKPYKTELPRKWRTWREQDILEFIATSYADGVELPEATEAVIEDMFDELDEREYEHNTFTPDEWDDSPELDMPSYSS